MQLAQMEHRLKKLRDDEASAQQRIEETKRRRQEALRVKEMKAADNQAKVEYVKLMMQREQE